MDKEKSVLLDTICQSADALHAEIDRYHALMVSVLTGNQEAAQLEDILTSRREPTVAQLKSTITETIGVLEESRKAFKSKQLEMLRKKLMRVLFETDRDCLAVMNNKNQERCLK